MPNSEKVPATEIVKRTWSEGIWMYLFHDSELQRGKKSVLVVLAPERTHPAYQAMEESFSEVEKELDEVHNVKVFFEDHPGGFLHEKFDLGAQHFQWYLIDIHGKLVDRSDRAVSVLHVLNALRVPSKIDFRGEDAARFEPTH